MNLQRDPTTMKPFLVRDGDFHPTVDHVIMKSGAGILCMLTHLLERGLYSGEPFMMESVNHRDADSFYWLNNTDGREYSMIQSLTENRIVAQRFDVGGEKVSLCFYRVDDNIDKGVRLRTPRQVATSEGSDACYVYADGYRANVIDGAGFRRLLEIFNLRWEVEVERPPTIDELISFCELFNDYDFATVAGWNDFITAFSLGGFFSIAESWSINDIHYYFGITLRSLTNVRIDAFDGQHRFLLLSMFLTGHFEVKPLVPHPRSSWANSVYAAKNDIGKSQLFERLGFNVGVVMTDSLVPIPEQPARANEYDHMGWRRTLHSRIAVVRSALKSAGGKITEAQQLHIEPTWPEFIQKIFQDPTMKECVDYTFQNFWLKTQRASKAKNAVPAAFLANMTVLHRTLGKILSGTNQARYKPLVLCKGNSDITKCLGDISTSLDNMRSFPPNRVSAEGTVMLELIRAFMHSSKSQNHFRRLLNPDGCGINWRQRSKELREHNARFRDPYWLRDNIVAPVRTVIDHIKKRINVERYIITMLRCVKEEDPDGPYHQFIDNDYKGSANSAHLFPDIPPEKDIAKLTEVSLRTTLFQQGAKFAGNTGTSQCNGLMNMIEFACYVQLTENIAKACVELGFDPDFARCPTYNHSLSESEKQLSTRIGEQRSSSHKAVVAQFTENGDYKPQNSKNANEWIFYPRFKRVRKTAAAATGDDTNTDEEATDAIQYNSKAKYHIYYDVDKHITAHLNEEEQGYYACTKSNVLLREYLT